MSKDIYIEENSYNLADKKTVNQIVGKVFGVMFIGLLITAAVTGLFGFTFSSMINRAVESGNVELEDRLLLGMIALLIVSALGLLIMSIVLPIMYMRGRHSILVPALIYVVLMGVMLSSLVIAGIGWEIFAITFGITAGIFGIMALLALLAKGNMNGVLIVILGLSIGIGLAFPLYLVAGLFASEESFIMIYMVIYLAVLALIMFTTLWDVYRIKKIASRGIDSNNNVILYSAFIIYTDFINIFIRVLRLVLILSSRRK